MSRSPSAKASKTVRANAEKPPAKTGRAAPTALPPAASTPRATVATRPGNSGKAHGTSAKARRPSQDEIARRAFEIYEREGRPQGRAAEHWVRAEAELVGLAATR